MGATVPYLVAEIKLFLNKMNIRTSGAGLVAWKRVDISMIEVAHQPRPYMFGGRHREVSIGGISIVLTAALRLSKTRISNLAYL